MEKDARYTGGIDRPFQVQCRCPNCRKEFVAYSWDLGHLERVVSAPCFTCKPQDT